MLSYLPEFITIAKNNQLSVKANGLLLDQLNTADPPRLGLAVFVGPAHRGVVTNSTTLQMTTACLMAKFISPLDSETISIV